MDAMEAKMSEWRRRVPSKRALTSQLGQFVQQKSVAVLYTPSEQERIKHITDLIAKATCEFEKEEHWDRIMKVVDALGATANKSVVKEAIRYLRLRLGDPSPRVVLLGLTLTETLVKNGDHFIHKEIASEAFMNEMEALYKVHSCKRGRDSMEIEGRVLELIQCWGKAFINQKFEFPYFIYIYEKLRKKGVRFPKYNKNDAPIHTPPSSKKSTNQHSRPRMESTTSTSSLTSLSSTQVYHVATNVAEMFEDMMQDAEQDHALGGSGVMEELAIQAQELIHRLQTVIQSVADSDSDDLGKYLAVNDQLHNVMIRYETLQARKKEEQKTTARRRSTQPIVDTFGFDTMSISNQQEDEDDDGFGEFVRARVESVSKDSNQQSTEDDPFASFVQERTTKSVSTPAAPSNNLIDLWDDVPLQPTPPTSTPSSTDLWGTNDLVQTPPVATHTLNNNDDIWNDLQATTPAQVPQPSSAQEGNPFDIFEDVSKPSTSTPLPVQNPFDICSPLSQAHPTTVPPTNPFDF